MLSLRRLQGLFHPLKARVVLRGLIGGLGMGLDRRAPAADAVLGRGRNVRPDRPCGRDRCGDANRAGAVQTVRHLLVARHRLERRLHLPIMFASVALGLAAALVFPDIPVAVAVAATMAGALRRSVAGAFLGRSLRTSMLVQMETAAVIAVAVVVSALLATRCWRSAPPAAPQTRCNTPGVFPVGGTGLQRMKTRNGYWLLPALSRRQVRYSTAVSVLGFIRCSSSPDREVDPNTPWKSSSQA